MKARVLKWFLMKVNESQWSTKSTPQLAIHNFRRGFKYIKLFLVIPHSCFSGSFQNMITVSESFYFRFFLFSGCFENVFSSRCHHKVYLDLLLKVLKICNRKVINISQTCFQWLVSLMIGKCCNILPLASSKIT